MPTPKLVAPKPIIPLARASTLTARRVSHFHTSPCTLRISRRTARQRAAAPARNNPIHLARDPAPPEDEATFRPWHSIMPPKKRAQPAEEYSSDGGFVANDSAGERPRGKKVKMEKAGKRAGTSQTEVVGGGVGEGEEVWWELSGKKRVTIAPFKGKILVSIREFYEKDGQSLPGRKGISLPIEQFSALVTLLPHIESVLKDKGIELARPRYGAAGGARGADGDGEQEEEEEVDVGRVSEKVSPGAKKKKNFEATSEEEGE